MSESILVDLCQLLITLISWLADLMKLRKNIVQLDCVAFALISFYDTKMAVANNFEIWAPYNTVSYVMQIWNENPNFIVDICM